MMYGYVYLTTNLINNRLYIGSHKSSTFDKTYKGSGRFLKQAFEKYGWENFKCEILKECESPLELIHTERLFIALYDAVHSPLFYNMKEGGEGYKVDGVPIKKGVKCSKKACENISKAHIGLKWSDAQRNAHIGLLAKEKNPMYKKDFSPETKVLLSKIRRGRIWINNGENETQIPLEKFNEFFSKGYVKGRLSKSTYNWIESSLKRKHCWVTKDCVNLRIYLDELEKYISLGYNRGRYLPKRSATTTESISSEKDATE